MSIVIKVANLSKQYRLGDIGTGTISHDVNRWWHRVRGNDDPYLKIGDENDHAVNGNNEYIWALKDINFEVKHGEVLGIIGRNGAGKSTLLKILSRTTAPTTGEVKIKGRVASLLEVGTGFHGELTGRENVFLNGAIMGMTKAEIKKKFDEIVDFSGVERYIDTPVKRYSSGMYVRLAFGVAAHLEPEILIVDEVLAVGDAEFQKKALGKMKDVSNKEGRTVLFVSHNMAAIGNLCTQSMLLKSGTIHSIGITKDIISNYLTTEASDEPVKLIDFEKGEIKIELLDETGLHTTKFKLGSSFSVKFKFQLSQPLTRPNIGIGINDYQAQRVVTYHTTYQTNEKLQLVRDEIVCCTVPSILLMPGKYYVEFSLFEEMNSTIYNQHNVFEIEIQETDYFKTGKLPNPAYQGLVVGDASWTTIY
jgi:lipopolysaccharide transport system ATP-binding protein